MINILNSNSGQKAGGQTPYPIQNPMTIRHLKSNVFAKSLKQVLVKCMSSLLIKCIKIPVKGPSLDVIVRQVSFLRSFSINGDKVFYLS